MGMTRTRDRNAVLILVFPKRRTVVILGDHAIHNKIGQAFWKETIEKTICCFKAEEYTQGIIHAIEVLGKALARYFPKAGSDMNSLPNKVVEN